MSESFQWVAGVEKRPKRAIGFYATIGNATLVGLLLNFMNVNPINALFWLVAVKGVVAGPVLVFTMLLAQNSNVMGPFTVRLYLRFVGWLTTAVMLLASIGMIATMHL